MCNETTINNILSFRTGKYIHQICVLLKLCFLTRRPNKIHFMVIHGKQVEIIQAKCAYEWFKDDVIIANTGTEVGHLRCPGFHTSLSLLLEQIHYIIIVALIRHYCTHIIKPYNQKHKRQPLHN
jgi:hypothetical protein